MLAEYNLTMGASCEGYVSVMREIRDCVCFPSGLLTEVQCQSKRLRKGAKGRLGGQEEEESSERSRVSSTNRLLSQVANSTIYILQQVANSSVCFCYHRLQLLANVANIRIHIY